nr:carbohydrate ABC transporter permease [Ethanoligenens harbinense]
MMQTIEANKIPLKPAPVARSSGSSQAGSAFLKVISLVVKIFLAILFLSPFYILIVNSFKTRKEIFTNTLALPAIPQWNNYSRALDAMNFLSALRNSLVITLCSVGIIIVFTSMAAWMITRTKTKVSQVLYLVFVASMIIPFQAIMLPLMREMGQLNLLNIPGLIFVYLGFGASMGVFIFSGFVKSIPKELDEAAMMDGCNTLQTFWYIIFPLLKPATFTIAVLDVVWIWNDYLLPSLTINNPGTMTIPLQTFFFFGQFTKQWDMALAALVMCIIPVIVFYLFAQKYIIKAVTAGSIK